MMVISCYMYIMTEAHALMSIYVVVVVVATLAGYIAC